MKDEGSAQEPAAYGAAGSSLPSVDLLVVTANPSVSLGLAEQSVVEVSPATFAAWLRSVDRPTPRGVVLDRGSPSDASTDLAALRARGIQAPVVLVTDGSEGWLDLAKSEGVAELGPPVTRAALRDAVASILGHLPVTPPAPSTRSRRWAIATELAPRLRMPDRVARDAPEARRTADPLARDTADPEVERTRAHETARSARAAATEPHAATPEASGVPGPEPGIGDAPGTAGPAGERAQEPPEAPTAETPEPVAAETPEPVAPEPAAPEPAPAEPAASEPPAETPEPVAPEREAPRPDSPRPVGPDDPARVSAHERKPPAGDTPRPAAAKDSRRNGGVPSAPAASSRSQSSRRAQTGTPAQPMATPTAGDPVVSDPDTPVDPRMPMVLVDQSRPPDLRRDRGRAQPKAREKRPVKRRLAPSPKGRRADRVATPPVPLAPDATPSEPALDTPGEPRLAATAERVPAVDTSTRDLTAPAAPQGLEPLPAAMPLTRRGDVMLLVRELLERSDELVVYHLGLVAQAIVEDVIENLPADAACVLVDDHGQWRVEGASGLREVETQLVLTDDHWLVAQTVRAGSAVAIEDTDIARVQLRGAPLASWPYLMAEGTPDGKALVIAVRDLSGEGFSESDVVRVADLCQEGQRYLAAAREVRALVRRLSDE